MQWFCLGWAAHDMVLICLYYSATILHPSQRQDAFTKSLDPTQYIEYTECRQANFSKSWQSLCVMWPGFSCPSVSRDLVLIMSLCYVTCF